MNERNYELAKQAGLYHKTNLIESAVPLDQMLDKFVELMTAEFIGLLEYEIAMLEKYKTTACNDFDRRWHEGKIVHFNKLIEKTKDHFGVEE